jgi:hypothetical protein
MIPETSAERTGLDFTGRPLPDPMGAGGGPFDRGGGKPSHRIPARGPLVDARQRARWGRLPFRHASTPNWARELTGPWTPHSANPVLIDRSAARPAGPRCDAGRAGLCDRPRTVPWGYGAGLALAEIVVTTKNPLRAGRHRPTVPGPGSGGAPPPYAGPGRRSRMHRRIGHVVALAHDGLQRPGIARRGDREAFRD